MYKRLIFIFIVVVGIGGYFLLSSNSGSKAPDDLLVFTQVPVSESLSGKNQHLPDYDHSRIVSLNLNDQKKKVRSLTENFYAACSPSFSIDHKQIVFSAKENAEDPWQIWIMNSNGSGAEKVLEISENCYSPAFLPDGKIVFSRALKEQDFGKELALFTCQPDGLELDRITFHPHVDLYPTILHDGRIAMNSRQIFPEIKNADLMVLRPDGTKCQSFYHRADSLNYSYKLAEGPGKDLYFIESNTDTDFLKSVRYTNPARTEKIIFEGPVSHLHSFDLQDSIKVVISFKEKEDSPYNLYQLNLFGEKELLFADASYHSIEPITVREKLTPKKLPSTVSMEKGIATMIGQNAGYSQIELEGNPETKFIRVLGIGGIMQELPVEEDGSFYLKVQSNTPFRMESLGQNGELLRGPSSWIWLRTNERRGCTGCHAKKEITPENLVPKAIYNPPYWVTDTSEINKSNSIVWHQKAEVKDGH